MLDRRWGTGALLLLGGACALSVGQACKDPTEVTLDIQYHGGSCRELTNVVIIVGTEPAALEARTNGQVFPTAVTQNCQDGQVGTLVITPNGSDHAAVLVVAGVGVQAETCRAETGYLGCIVARRQVGFISSTPLTLPIVLERTCANVPCDATSSCKDGRCASSIVACVDHDCSAFGITATGAPALVPDAPTSPPDKGALCPPAKRPLACGEDQCAAGQACCYTGGPTSVQAIRPEGTMPIPLPLPDASSGTSGTSGGTSGTSGGTSGTSGTSGGTSGTSGGTSGTSGGTSGTSGGTSGTSGGTSGTSGGTSGTSGVAGTSGTSGFGTTSGTCGGFSSSGSAGTSGTSGTVPPPSGETCGSCSAAGVQCFGRENCGPEAPVCCFLTPPGGAPHPTTACQTACVAAVACHENCDCPDGFVCETRELSPGVHQCVPK